MAHIHTAGVDSRRTSICELSPARKQENKDTGSIVYGLLLLVFLLPTLGVAQEYKLQVSVSPNDFFGVCETNTSWLECVGNFVSPVLPNPLKMLEPLSGTGLSKKIDAVNFIKTIQDYGLDLDKLFNNFINVPIIMFYTLVEVSASIIKFILIFAFRFMFVYLFYIDLGLQSIILMLDQNSNRMSDLRKIQSSILFMALATIAFLTYTGGWVNWT